MRRMLHINVQRDGLIQRRFRILGKNAKCGISTMAVDFIFLHFTFIKDFEPSVLWAAI